MIALERGPAAVKRVAIDLDDHPRPAPQEVDFVATHPNVGLGPRQRAAPDHRLEALLGLRARHRRRAVGARKLPQDAAPRRKRVALEHGQNFAVADQPARERLVVGVLELAVGQAGREVANRSRRARDRNPLADAEVTPFERPGPVDMDTVAPPGGVATDEGDVDIAARGGPDLPRRRGRGVTQDRRLAAGQDRGLLGGERRERLGRDEGVDAAMQPVEATYGEGVLDRSTPDSGVDELVKRDHPALARRELTRHAL
jgi:hypothetical protein